MNGEGIDRPEVILRPPVIYATFLLLGSALHYAWPAPISKRGNPRLSW